MTVPTPRVLVTRPAAQAEDWAARLAARGIDAVALPLIDIAAPEDVEAVVEAWHSLAACRAVFFVSPNAVDRFFAARPEGVPWPTGTQAASPGPGTTRTLRAHGVDTVVEPPADATQFDSEALWPVLSASDWRGAQVLCVRGGGGRDWLAERFRESGAAVRFVSAYRRRAPVWGASQRTLADAAEAAPKRHLWFFSSSEALDHLQALRPDAHWSAAQALATHPRIAERARRLGFGRVVEARPAFDDVVACIQSRAP